MGVAALLVIGAVIVGGVSYLRYRAGQQRIRAVAALAQRLGFGFRVHDDDHIADMPFALFARGDGHEADLIVSGTHNGMRLRMFDFMYYENRGNGRGNRSRSSHYEVRPYFEVETAVRSAGPPSVGLSEPA